MPKNSSSFVLHPGRQLYLDRGKGHFGISDTPKIPDLYHLGLNFNSCPSERQYLLDLPVGVLICPLLGRHINFFEGVGAMTSKYTWSAS